MSITYRKLDARNDKDFCLFLAMEDSLDDYLKTNKSEENLTQKHLWTRVHMGAVEFLDDFKYHIDPASIVATNSLGA